MRPNAYRPRKGDPRSPIDGEPVYDYCDYLPTAAGIRAACDDIHQQRTFPEDEEAAVQTRPHRLHVEV